MDVLDTEERIRIAYPCAEKPADATQGRIQKPGKRRHSQAIGPEDFEEGSEREAFNIIYSHAHNLFARKKISSGKFLASLSFFFAQQSQEEVDCGDPDFDLCCAVLQSRKDVIRLRIQYEWWLRGAIFTGPFPFAVTCIPTAMQDEISYYFTSASAAIALASETWMQPGIPTPELILATARNPSCRGYSLQELRNSLEHLESRRFMSCSTDRWYMTGRNPMVGRHDSLHPAFHKGGSAHWGRLFPHHY